MNDIFVTKEMIEAGEKIIADRIDADMLICFNDLSKRDKIISKYDNSDLILKYLDGEITSVEAIYMAMEREKYSRSKSVVCRYFGKPECESDIPCITIPGYCVHI